MTKDSTRKWLFTLVLGLIIWSFLFFTRIYWYTPWCAVNPTPCLADHVNQLDRIVFQFGSVQADFWSNVTQNFVGIVVFILPWFLFSRKIALAETLITASITFWNLAWLEVFRAIAQRPRPLVFNSVFGDGANINQYTSFYSGHTSFVAVATLSLYFLMKRQYPSLSRTVQKSLLLAFVLFTLLTGTLRVLGGRHYPTDTLAGMLIGIMIVLYFQKRVDTVR
jgi:membrane-associated phospholipid phosphatase